MSDTTQTIILRSNPPNQKGTKYCKENHIRPYSDPIAGTSLSWMAIPGDYEVSIEVEVKKKKLVSKRKLQLLKDPNTLSTQDELVQQNRLSRRIFKLLNNVVNNINTCEWLSYQAVQIIIKNNGLPKDIVELLTTLVQNLQSIEAHLFQARITGQGEDLSRFPGKLVSNLSYLGSLVGTGDYPPTEQQIAQYINLRKEVKKQRRSLKGQFQLVKEINAALSNKSLPLLVKKLPKEFLCPELFNTGPAF